MSRKLDIASAISVALTLTVTLLSTDGSGAAAESRNPQVRTPQIEMPAPAPAESPDNLLPATYPVSAANAVPTPAEVLPPAVDAAAENLSLADMVADQDTSGPLTSDLECLAGAVYFEAKSETLEGQLAVGRVVVNRARSGRFPGSYCGVVYQPSQFSFVRGRAMPAISRSSRDWKEAVAIARIAHEGTWNSPVEGALFFHAARVSPGWRLTRIARVDNHIFYR